MPTLKASIITTTKKEEFSKSGKILGAKLHQLSNFSFYNVPFQLNDLIKNYMHKYSSMYKFPFVYIPVMKYRLQKLYIYQY